ncbi:response regulator, partial [candidate division KSB1 bacterium]|nr:response regulator [candidate division KSB1 bacterium]
MSAPNILIVDDEKNIRRSVAMICSGEGYETQTAADSEEALKMLDAGGIDLALLDIAMPGMDGLSLLKEIKKKFPATSAIMISGNATLQNAITATKEGAFDFIEKPITKEKLLISISNALQSRTLEKENIEIKK